MHGEAVANVLDDARDRQQHSTQALHSVLPALLGQAQAPEQVHAVVRHDQQLAEHLIAHEAAAGKVVHMVTQSALAQDALNGHPVVGQCPDPLGTPVEVGDQGPVFVAGQLHQHLLAACGKTVDDVDLYVPHQANVRIIDHATKKLGFPTGKVVVNVDKYGNTSSGSIPLALADAAADGRLRPGELVLMTGMGAGLTWGSALIEWTEEVTAS